MKKIFAILSILLISTNSQLFAQQEEEAAQNGAIQTPIKPARTPQNSAMEFDPTNKESFEKELVRLADSMRSAIIPEERFDYCVEFVGKLNQFLKQTNSYDYPFEQLKTMINIVSPEDKSFKIFNWLVNVGNNKIRYYGALQMPGSQLKLYPFFDISDKADDQITRITLNTKNWFGGEIYNILPQKAPDGQPYYLVFSRNNGLINSTRKVVDVLTFNNGQPSFGLPIFKAGEGDQQRFIIEYQKGAQVSLNFDKEKNAITFDRLESNVNQPTRKHTLVPAGQTDGLRYANGYWVFQKDIIPIMQLGDGNAPVKGVLPGGK